MKNIGYDQTPHACRHGGTCKACNAPEEPRCSICDRDQVEMADPDVTGAWVCVECWEVRS